MLSPPLLQAADSGDAAREATQLPSEALLVKGAWSSASDPTTPVPEGGELSEQHYRNAYFGLDLPLPAGWAQKFEGPPPSDTGHYVLAQLRPANKARASATLLITAQDLFFTPTPARTPVELLRQAREHLEAGERVERTPRTTTIGGRAFARMAYRSDVTGLHFNVLATETRCHVVQLVFTSRDRRLVRSLAGMVKRMEISTEADGGRADGSVPVCIAGYASGEQVLARVEPVFAQRRFNSVPVRVIIDASGRVKHIHFISAFPDQAKSITDALMQWRFRPYSLDGHPVEVETGILFGPGSGRTGASQ
jgi:hypothetical protein